MNTATGNSVAEMNIFHCHHISGFSTAHRLDDGPRALTSTLKSFPYIWGERTRGIHKYKCLFYQTNAYQTGIIVCCAHNKEHRLVHFILWTLSSTAEIKNIFAAAILVSLCKPLPAAVKNLLRNASVKVGFYGEPHHSGFQVITWAWQWGKTTENSFFFFLCCLNSKGRMSHYYTI